MLRKQIKFKKPFIAIGFLISLILIISLPGCEKEIEWKLEESAHELIVVDALITNSPENQRFELEWVHSGQNTIPRPVSGAVVSLVTSDTVYLLSENSLEYGHYEIDTDFKAIFGVDYTLNIEYDGKTYSASAEMAKGSFMYHLNFQDADSGMLTIGWVREEYSANSPAMYEVLLDWSDVPGYESVTVDECIALLYYYSLPTLDISQIFAPKKQKAIFPKGTKVTERKYSLTQEHAEFYRAILAETEWRGYYFDAEQANIPTNLSQGAVGYFGVSEVVSASFVAQ